MDDLLEKAMGVRVSILSHHFYITFTYLPFYFLTSNQQLFQIKGYNNNFINSDTLFSTRNKQLFIHLQTDNIYPDKHFNFTGLNIKTKQTGPYLLINYVPRPEVIRLHSNESLPMWHVENMSTLLDPHPSTRPISKKR